MKKRQSAVRGEVKWHGEERKKTTMGMIQREGRKKKEKKKQPVASHGTAPGEGGVGDGRGHGRLSFPLALH